MQKSPSTFMTPLSSNISPTCGLVEVMIITMATIDDVITTMAATRIMMTLIKMID